MSSHPALDPCDDALVATRAFLEGSLVVEQEQRWRRHMESCGECRDAYRAAVVTTARIGRSLRQEREEHARRTRREAFRRQVREAGAPAPRFTFGRARLLLYPAILVLLLSQLAQGPSPGPRGLRVQLEAGSGWLGGEVLPLAEANLASGQLLQLEQAARATVRGRRRTLELLGPARLLVESAASQRLRLVEGELVHAGQGVLVTAQGVLEVHEGRVGVVLRGASLQVLVLAGSASFVDGNGRVELGKGQLFEPALAHN